MTTTLGPPSPPSLPPIDADAPEAHPPGLLDRWSDPLVMLVAAAVLAVVGLIPSAIKAPITLPVVLLLPGHALLAALDRPDRTLGAGPRIALRMVLSLAVVSLAVLAVGWVVGVGELSAVGSIWAVTSIFALAAWNRDLPTDAASAGPRWTQSGVLLAVTGLVAVAVVAIALLVLPEPRDEPFHRVAFAGSTKASGSPIVVSSGRTAAATVQVANGTDRTITYRVIPAIDGGLVWPAPRLRLRPGDVETVRVSGRIPRDACLSRLTVALAADGEDSGVAPLVTYVRNEAGDACG